MPWLALITIIMSLSGCQCIAEHAWWDSRWFCWDHLEVMKCLANDWHQHLIDNINQLLTPTLLLEILSCRLEEPRFCNTADYLNQVSQFSGISIPSPELSCYQDGSQPSMLHLYSLGHWVINSLSVFPSTHSPTQHMLIWVFHTSHMH